MAEIATAEQATDSANRFLGKYYFLRSPVGARREDDRWIVRVDIGAFTPAVVTVTIDARSGDVLEYDLPDGAA